MDRSTRINRKTYLKLLKELKRNFKELGYEFRLYRRPISWSSVRSGVHDRYGTVYGWCDVFHKRARVTVRGNQSRAHVLAVIAHELRHAQHKHEELFMRYYLPSPRCMQTAFEAEYDCDTYAINWLKERGIHLRKKDQRCSDYKDFNSFKPFWNRLVTVTSS